MRRTALAITAILFTGLAPGMIARASLQAPEASERVPSSSPVPDSPGANAKKDRKIGSFVYGQGESLARFRPVEREDENIDYNSAERMLRQKTGLAKAFDGDFEHRMREEYAKRVTPYEATANDPVWRARAWERQRYEGGQHDLASWTTHEVLEDQLKNLLNGGDQSSAPIKVLTAAHDLSGGGDDDQPKKMTAEEKAARAHRRDLPPSKEEEEASTPTKLRTKLNVLQQNGSFVFSNPVATTSLKGDRDDVSLNMNREFHKLTMKSQLNYGLKESCLNFNLNKRITDQVSLDLDHASYTGGKSGPTGEKSREQARLNYSLNF